MTLMCIDRSQSPTHKGNFLQGRKSPVNNNINQHNANHQRRNSCSPPLTKNHQQQEVSSSIKSLNLDTRKLERSASEPDRRTVQTTNSSRYKTELCRPFEENGTCKYGDKCQFAHGSKELRSMARHPKYKTELCRTFHSTGLCPYGPRCHFIHNSDQSKKSLLTTLTINGQSTNPPINGQNTNPPVTKPKPLNSVGSTVDISPVSSLANTPTAIKSFDDMFHNPLSPTLNNSFSIPPEYANWINSCNQRNGDLPSRELSAEIYDAVSVFSEGILSIQDNNVDNYNYQRGPVLDLYQTAPLTPPTPIDMNAGSFRIPLFDFLGLK